MEPGDFEQVLISKLIEKSKISPDLDSFCEGAVEILRPVIAIDAIVFVERLDESTFEKVYTYNRSYAPLDEDTFLKVNRKTPLTDAINLRKTQAWGSSQRIIREYPEAISWPLIPHTAVAVPIVEGDTAVAGCAFVSKEEFLTEEKYLISSLLETVTNLIHQLRSKE